MLHGSLIHDSSNNYLQGNDGTNGHDYALSSTADNGLFWFEQSDPNRDRSVGQDDMNIIAANYSHTVGYTHGDLNYDGVCNFSDLVTYSRANGQSVPQMLAPGAPALAAAGTDRLLLSWPASTDPNVASYDVYRNWQRVGTNVPTASYMDSGLAANTSYTYAIVARDSSGHSSYTTRPFIAATAATGALTVQPVTNQNMTASGTLTVSTTFADTGPAATHSATINWGDGNTTSASVTESNNSGTISGSHTYAGSGPYYAVLTVQGTNGETAATVFPVAAFYDASPGYTVGQASSLVPVLIDPGGNANTVQQYTVSWGDGSATETDPGTAGSFSHAYASEASSGYTATVVATGSDGTYTDMPVINEVPPTLSLSGLAAANEGSTFTLTAAVADGDTGENYSWQIDWGDGSAVQTLTAPAGPFTYVYSEAGTYTVSALVSETDDSAGQGDMASATASVNEATPADSFSANSGSVAEGTALGFADTFSDPGGDTLDGLTVAWGDGNTDAYNGNPAATAHTYAEAGAYTATAVFSTEDGLYTVTTAVSATEVTPSVSASMLPGAAIEGDTFLLAAGLSDPGSNDTPTQWTIAWGDGQSSTFGTNPDYQGDFPHVYTDPHGSTSYTLTATATSDDGTYSTTGLVSVAEAAPAFSISGVRLYVAGQPYTEIATFSDPAGDTVETYAVDWGDGTTQNYGGGSTATFSHAYQPGSTYGIAVTAFTSDESTSYIATDAAEAYDQAADGIAFNVSPSSVNEGATVTASANWFGSGQDALEKWMIAWGDGQLGGDDFSPTASETFSHTYAEPGTYTPILAMKDYEANGGNDHFRAAVSHASVVVNEVAPAFTVTGDTPATVTGDTYTLTPTFTDAGSNDAPQQWTVVWGDGSTQVYFPQELGNSVNFGHIYKAAAPAGTTYTQTVSVVIDDGTYSATTSVIIGQPTMNVIQGDGTAMDHAAQQTTGAFLAINDDDDGAQFDGGGNPIPDYNQTSLASPDPDLLEVDLQTLPAAVGGTLSLSWSTSDFTVWNDAKKDVQLFSGCQFNATAGGKVFLEGRTLSSQMAQDLLEEDWAAPVGGGQGAAKVDFVRATVVDLTGPQNVPAYGQYQYKIVGAAPWLNTFPDPWTATGGTVTAERLDHRGAFVKWNQPLGGANAGWTGTVVYTAFGNKFVLGYRHTNVINVVVTVPNGAFSAGMPFDTGGTTTHQGIAMKDIASGNPEGLTWKATVTLNGPNGNTGVRRITVGFVQNLISYQNTGTYKANKTRTSDAVAKIAAAPVLDRGTSSQPPWYFVSGQNPGDAMFTNASANQNSKTITSWDQPHLLTPASWELADHFKAGMHVLVQTATQDSFRLDVCAQTTDADASGSSKVYVREASATFVQGNSTNYGWLFNGSGTIDSTVQGLPWTKIDGVTGVTQPSAWTQITDGSSPVTTGIVANDLGKSEKFS